MKKALQSIMTAAIFASSLGTGIGDTSAFAFTSDDITQIPATTYGPPYYMQTEPDETICTTSEIVYGTTVATPAITTSTTTTGLGFEGTVTTPTTTAPDPVVLDGVAPVIEGDQNYDGSIDARDVSLLKQDILNGRKSGTDDINHDGTIDKDDVKALIRMLTGKPEDEEEPITTDIAPFTTTIASTTIIQTSYGPPPAWQ